MLAKESVADLPFRVFRFDDFKHLIAKIFQGAFSVRLPSDLERVADLQIVCIDSLALEVARTKAFQETQMLKVGVPIVIAEIFRQCV